MKIEHVAWSRGIFDSLRDGGVWAVPRSGLVFTRRGAGLVLTSRLPWDAAMAIAKDRLIAYQAADFDAIAATMLAAGVPVTDSTGLRPAN